MSPVTALIIVAAGGVLFALGGAYVARRQAKWMADFYTQQNKDNEQ
ncbi:hypothetical protein [Cupriavidus numazuensis]|uniref:Uncharacterized protein n=1 Tax=Cupriavidus numazuensis TaxID=221992 RepID=A0ABM8TB08_9BURK|nr:hypothetical protein [Cupriavidus numazuensis]CAG2132187.1 hypothetical protein LMG26411_00572 [Cupriavidus numazuensis]